MMLGGMLFTLASCAFTSADNQYFVNTDRKGVIIDGYDPVAFFTENKPVQGNPSIKYTYHEATYYFSTEANKKAFIAAPTKYEPQYGGYCGYAVSQGHTAPIDVNFFSIINGRLIFQHNQRALDGWNKDPQSLTKADKYWPQISSKHGKPLIPDEEKHYLVNVNKEGFFAEGYDVVAYFTQGKPVKGNPQFIKLHKGGFYAFSSEENKKLFGDNPEKYIPQYGGFCAYAVSRNKLRPIDPQYFQIIDGRLMLQHSKKALNLFSEDIPGNTKMADQYWPGLVSQRAGKEVSYDSPAN